MSASPLVLVPNEILRNPSRDVLFDKKTRVFSQDLTDTLVAKKNPKGVGLSAPQIGKNWNVFVTWLNKDVERDPALSDLSLFINPSIVDFSKEITFGDDPENPILEGCLSIPGFYGPVPRHESLTISYTTLENSDFVKKTETFDGFMARVIQHEYDHLQGILFTDYSLKHDLPVYEFKGKKMIEINKSLLESF